MTIQKAQFSQGKILFLFGQNREIGVFYVSRLVHEERDTAHAEMYIIRDSEGYGCISVSSLAPEVINQHVMSTNLSTDKEIKHTVSQHIGILMVT